MDELTVMKEKRPSGFARMKIKAGHLANDVAALERLVDQLLKHLARAIDPAVTDQERTRYGNMINEIRATLVEGAAERKTA